MHTLGRHLILELFDCDSEVLNNLEAVKGGLAEAARRAQATIVATSFHQFNPFGISGVVVIAESHLSVHTWPEYRYAAVDIFSCGKVLKPDVAVRYLTKWFRAKRVSVVELQRGVFVLNAVLLTPKHATVDSHPHAPGGLSRVQGSSDLDAALVRDGGPRR